MEDTPERPDRPAGAGALSIVGTPIGNLGDVTLRALEVLKQADWIACEDTRQSLKLLNHYGIRKRLVSIFGPKEARETPRLLQSLARGERVALLTDAGTPGISDPGRHWARAAREAGFRVEPVPGVSALSTAISASGLGQDGFVFLGFLHRKSGKMKKELQRAAQLELPVVFFESPFRVVATLETAREALGPQTRCWIGREMTKKFEEYKEGAIDDMIQHLSAKEALGEFTIILTQGERS